MTTSADIRGALRGYFCAPEYAIAFEVPNATGAAGGRRRADAVVMSLWPSRGLTLECLEIKVSRSDWLREKKDPEKAEMIAAYCDLFSVVAPAGLIKPTEVPHAWGLYEVSDKGVVKLAKAPSRTEAKPLDRAFLAAMLRAAGKPDQEEIKALIQAEREAMQAEINARVEAMVERRTRDAGEASRLLAALTESHGYLDAKRIAAAAGVVEKAGLMGWDMGLVGLQQKLAGIATDLAEALAEAGVPEAADLKRFEDAVNGKRGGQMI